MRSLLDWYQKTISNSTEQRLMCYEGDSPEAQKLRLPPTSHIRTLQPLKSSPEF